MSEKVLTLSIKQKYFDQILSGEKKVETREILPNNVKKYCKVDKEGFVVEDDKGIVPRKYDKLKLLTGAYVGKRPYLIVDVESINIILLTDDDGEFIICQDENQNEYNAAVAEFKLGKIIDKSLKN